MCDFSKGIKLCICDSDKIAFRRREFYRKVKGELVKIPDKRNDEIPLIYVWALFRLINKESEWMSLGKYLFPSDDIGSGLNAEWIALNLNVENCFDFDYKPQDGDNLFIGQNIELAPYISFVYQDNAWTIDSYSTFDFVTEHIKNGVVKPAN